jgi:hypothetical protein
VESVNRIKDVLDALKTPAGEPKWAKPRKAPSEPGTRPEEEAEIDTPFTDDDGRLPGGRCQVCGGTHGHVGVCPAGLAEMVEWLTRPSRVKVVRRYFPDYDPVMELKGYAEQAEKDDPGGAMAAYYRRAAAMAEEIIAVEGPLPVPEPDDGRGQSAIDYLSRPHSHVPPRQTPAPRRKDDHGKLFGERGPSNYDHGV